VHFIQLLRSRSGTGESANHVDPATLNEIDRRILEECFRQAQRVQRYLGTSNPELARDFGSTRFVAVDEETTGLGLRSHRDRLISTGAISVHNELVQLDTGFEIILRQSKPSANENILVHGIDGTTQTTGRDPAEALIEFLEYARKDLLVGFHAGFDKMMITRATSSVLGIRLENEWLDLAILAPEIVVYLSKGASTLDDWTDQLQITTSERHNAVADALVTAQLLQIILAAARERGISRTSELIADERAGRWLHTVR